MEWIDLIPSLLIGCACLLVGYALGARRARSVKRQAQRERNAQALELLDARASLHSLEHYASQQERKDKLLKMTLRKLQEANARCKEADSQLAAQKRQHYSETSRLRLDAVKSHETAVLAADIARKATAHLERLEQASPAIQTIKAPEPKSYGTGDAVTVSVVDQARSDTPDDAVIPVSNRDSARLTKLRSSNEANAPAI